MTVFLLQYNEEPNRGESVLHSVHATKLSALTSFGCTVHNWTEGTVGSGLWTHPDHGDRKQITVEEWLVHGTGASL